MAPWLVALVLTVAIEVPVVAAFFPGQRLRLAFVALGANVVTNLVLNIVLARSAWGGHHLVPGEVFAVVGEALAYSVFSRPPDVARAALASGVANLLSFAVGFTPLGAILSR
jgi:hypothetical protein